MNCFVCSKKKEDYEVWINKIVIGAMYNSDFQDKDIIRNMPDRSVIYHNCIREIKRRIDMNRDHR